MYKFALTKLEKKEADRLYLLSKILPSLIKHSTMPRTLAKKANDIVDQVYEEHKKRSNFRKEEEKRKVNEELNNTRSCYIK